MWDIKFFCFISSYVVAFAFELMRLRHRSATQRVVMLGFGLAGFIAQTLFLLQRSRAEALPPLLRSSQDWLLVVAWIAILLYLFLTALDRDLAIGVFVLPLVLLLVGVAATPLVSDRPIALMTASRGWKMLHAATLALGTAGVLVGFVLALMYLTQHYRLKHKQTSSTGLTLPSLENLARFNRLAVMTSVPLLTVGIVSGLVLGFVSRRESSNFRLADPYVLVNGAVWAVMIGVFVWLLVTRRPIGRQVAWVTLWAFGFLLVTVVVLEMLTGGGMYSWHAGAAK
jgi:ABC-type uncharacterized transport system permease subunit